MLIFTQVMEIYCSGGALLGMTGHWRPMMTAGSGGGGAGRENLVHPLYPESEEVPAERLALFPAGCLIAGAREARCSVMPSPIPAGLAGPRRSTAGLANCASDADCLYLHDVALLPEARGLGLGELLVGLLRALGIRSGFKVLALTAVNRPHPIGDARVFPTIQAMEYWPPSWPLMAMMPFT